MYKNKKNAAHPYLKKGIHSDMFFIHNGRITFKKTDISNVKTIIRDVFRFLIPMEKSFSNQSFSLH